MKNQSLTTFLRFCIIAFACLAIPPIACKSIVIEKRKYLKHGYYVHFAEKRTSTPKQYSRTSAWCDTTTSAVQDTASDVIPPVDSVWTETCVNTYQDPPCVIWGFRLLPLIPSDTTILGYESFSFTEPGEIHNDTTYEEHRIVADSTQQTKTASRTSPPTRAVNRAYSYKTPVPRKKAFWLQGGLYGIQVPSGSPAELYSFSAGCGFRINSREKGSCTVGADLGFRYQEFWIKQNKPKPLFFNQEKHSRERIALHEIYTGFFLCWRLPKRPLDQQKNLGFGVFGCYSFRNANVYVDRHTDPETGMLYNVKTKVTHLSYIQDWNYGLSVRLTQNYFSVSASYRINQIMLAEKWNKDVPRLLISLEYVPHKKKLKDE